MRDTWRKTDAPHQQPDMSVSGATLDPEAKRSAKHSHMSDFKQNHMKHNNCLGNPDIHRTMRNNKSFF